MTTRITGYVVLRRLPGVDPEGQFSELVSNTGTAELTYTDDTVSAETRYTYRIKAVNEHGTSERSRWSHIDTPAAPAEQTGGESASPPTRTEPEDADFADSTATTGLVAVGESIVGRIGAAGDVDWILVQADPGQWFTITLTGYGEGGHTALETPYQQAYHQPDGSVLSPEYALNKDRPPCSSGCTHVEVSQAGSRYVAVASLVGRQHPKHRFLPADRHPGTRPRGRGHGCRRGHPRVPPHADRRGIPRLQPGLEPCHGSDHSRRRRLVPHRPGGRQSLPVRVAPEQHGPAGDGCGTPPEPPLTQ